MRSTAGRGHLGAGRPEETEGLTDEDNKCHVELAFSYEMADMVDHGTNQEIKTDEVLVVRYDRQGCLLEVVIEREMNVLTAEEIRAHKAEVNTAYLDEIKRWLSMDMFERSKRRDATNLVDSRWVIKFKLVNGVKMIKARLTVRSFKELAAQTGSRVRSIQLDLSRGSGALLRTLEGYINFGMILETLYMLKPGFGTKNAPWA